MGSDTAVESEGGEHRWPADLVARYEELRPRLVRLAYLVTGEVLVAEEIVQEAFVAASERWDDVEQPAAYMRAAVMNRSRSHLRRRELERRHRRIDDELVDLGADELWDALRVLDDRQRAAVVLRYYEDLSTDDIAAALGCRPATVRTTLHRAMKVLRREVGQ